MQALMGSENLLRFKENCLLCVCGNGVCEYLPLKNDPSRYFYKCLSPICSKKNFLKYAEQLDKDDKLIDVPYCPGCNAGLCRVRKERDGENAGRILFLCTIREGHGSCGFKMYQDELMMMPPSPLTSGYGIGPQNMDLDMENGLCEKGPDSDLPLLTSGDNGTCSGSKKMKQIFQCQEGKLGESSSLPCKRLHNGDIKGASPPLNPMQAERPTSPVTTTPNQKIPLRPVNDLFLESLGSPNLSKNHPGAGTSILLPCNKIRSHGESRKLRQIQWLEDEPGESSLPVKRLCNGDNKGYSPQSDCRTLVQSESLVNSSDSMSFDTWNYHGVGSSSLSPTNTLPHVPPSCEEPSIVLSPNNCKSQSVSTACGEFAEKLQSDLLNTLETMDPKNHEAMSQEAEATFKVLDGISIEYGFLKQQVSKLIDSARSLHNKEAELSHTEAELKENKQQLDQLFKEKQMLEKRYAETSELHVYLQADYNVAKAAFDRAKLQLRR